MLEMKDVSFQYNRQKMVLDHVNMQFEPGKFYTIFGDSGSGKTTCLALLGGLEQPSEGQVLLDGEDIRNITGSRLRQQYVTYVFQDFKLFPYMTAVENLMAALYISKPKADKKEAKSRVIQILEQLGLDRTEMDRPVESLSGGQMQRVAIGRALVCDTGYILADEPTGNLDEHNTENIIQLLQNIVQKYNKCVVVVTHSAQVRDAADLCYVMKNGKAERMDR